MPVAFNLQPRFRPFGSQSPTSDRSQGVSNRQKFAQIPVGSLTHVRRQRLASKGDGGAVTEKQKLMAKLEKMLIEAFELRLTGASSGRLSRAQAYADGYMNALLEQGIATQRELLELVVEVRGKVEGPSTRILHAA